MRADCFRGCGLVATSYIITCSVAASALICSVASYYKWEFPNPHPDPLQVCLCSFRATGCTTFTFLLYLTCCTCIGKQKHFDRLEKYVSKLPKRSCPTFLVRSALTPPRVFPNSNRLESLYSECAELKTLAGTSPDRHSFVSVHVIRCRDTNVEDRKVVTDQIG